MQLFAQLKQLARSHNCNRGEILRRICSSQHKTVHFSSLVSDDNRKHIKIHVVTNLLRYHCTQTKISCGTNALRWPGKFYYSQIVSSEESK